MTRVSNDNSRLIDQFDFGGGELGKQRLLFFFTNFINYRNNLHIGGGLQSSLASSAKLPSSYSIEIWFRLEPKIVVADDDDHSTPTSILPIALLSMIGDRSELLLSLRLTVDRVVTFASSSTGNEFISSPSAIS